MCGYHGSTEKGTWSNLGPGVGYEEEKENKFRRLPGKVN